MTQHPHDETEPCPGGCTDIEVVHIRLNKGDERMNRIEAKLDSNCADTAEVLEILTLGRSFFKVVGHLGSFIKWFTAIAAPVLVFIYAIKDGAKH